MKMSHKMKEINAISTLLCLQKMKIVNYVTNYENVLDVRTKIRTFTFN